VIAGTTPRLFDSALSGRPSRERVPHPARLVARDSELGGCRAAVLECGVAGDVRGVEAVGIAQRERFAVERGARAKVAPVQ